MKTTVVRYDDPVSPLDQFFDWFREAKQNDVLIYHTGDLATDRDGDKFPLLGTLASRLYADQRDGYIALFQRKLRNGYEYRAVRCVSPGERVNFWGYKELGATPSEPVYA